MEFSLNSNTGYAMQENEINSEVLFWQRLILWWEANQDGPVPERMHVALEMAERRQKMRSEMGERENILH
jgi:hypothetical protein